MEMTIRFKVTTLEDVRRAIADLEKTRQALEQFAEWATSSPAPSTRSTRSPLGLTVKGLSVLRVLYDARSEGPVRVSAIAYRAALTEHGVMRILRRLADEGLVEPTGSNPWSYSLAPAGVDLVVERFALEAGHE